MVATDRRRGVRTLLPRMLVKFAVTVLVVLLAGSYYTYSQVSNHMEEMQTNAVKAMTDGTVAGLSDLIVTRDYGHLQETLRQSMDNSNITEIVITDLRGKQLSAMTRVDNKVEPEFNDENLTPPTDLKEPLLITEEPDKIIIWQKIDSNYHIGWLHIVMSTKNYQHILRTLTFNLAATIGVMLLLMMAIIGYQFMNAYGQMNQYETGLLDAVHTDPLTKLPNRLVLDSQLLKSMQGAVVNNTSFAVAFVDLDGFKKVNDTLGHKQGDELLIEVSRRFKKMLRDHDTVIRLGGDEFVLILNDIEQKDISKLLNRIIDRINQTYHIDGENVNVGISIGVAEYHIAHSTPGKLIAQADKAMYQAKRSGKNQVVFYKDIVDDAR